MSRPFFVLALASLALGARADVAYTVKPDPATGRLKVTMTIPVRSSTTKLQMPRWAPGSYRLVDNFARVQDFEARDAAAMPATFSKPDDHTWAVETAGGKTVTVSYTMPSGAPGTVFHYSGPSTYKYVVGRMQEKCNLALDMSEGWISACGLDEAKGKPNAYVAPDYDVLADNPVTLGVFTLDTHMVAGKRHQIAYRGQMAGEIGREYVRKVCEAIEKAQCDFFGDAPYNKYVWHFTINPGADGGGGLEHLSSTQISMAVGVGPGVVRVCWHEFFHLWNVKRIRSKPLGPFDYQNLPKTGALWWLEGVTDYYASLLETRYGWSGEDALYRSIASNVGGVRANAGRLEISPYDSSFRVGEAANGRGNSNGLRVSYYNTGWVLGMLLDIEVREKSGGKRSLDDVMRALYAMTKDGKPGFEEDEIRKQLVRFGGPSLGEYYDKIVMQPGELPVEEQLAKAGLKIGMKSIEGVDPGFDWNVASSKEGVRVTRKRGEGQTPLEVGDVLVEFGGTSLLGENITTIRHAMAAALRRARAGVPIDIKYIRGEAAATATVVPTATKRDALSVEVIDPADAAKKAFRDAWVRDRIKIAEQARRSRAS